MAVKFTKGDSMKSTRTLVAKSPPRDTQSAHNSAGLSPKNTMTGMPGFINTRQSRGRAGAEGGRGSGPHREDEIGKRGSSGAKGMADAHRSRGTVVRNYKAASSGKGSVQKSNDIGSRGPNSKGGAMAGAKGPPTSWGKLPGGGKASGIGNAKEGSAKLYGRSSPRQVSARGARGTMESLAGRARHGKSTMY